MEIWEWECFEEVLNNSFYNITSAGPLLYSSNLDQEAKYKVLSDEMHLLTKGVQAISIEMPNMSNAITRAKHGEKIAGEKK